MSKKYPPIETIVIDKFECTIPGPLHSAQIEAIAKALTEQRDAGARAERPRILAALPKEMIVHEYMPEENTPARKGWNDYRKAAITAITK